MNESLHYKIVPLNTLLLAYNNNNELVQTELDKFSCILNKDVEKFLREKAILFDRQGWSKTHLLYTSYKGEMVLVGYFTLANKNFVIKNNSRISKTLKKKVANFGQYNEELKQYIVPSLLIAQLGKNDNYRFLLTGDVLLKYACDEVCKVQSIVGGKFVYLECEDKERLKEFYMSNGFTVFGERKLESDEKDDFKSSYLIQMLRYLK